MKVAIIGTNGMLSVALSKFYKKCTGVQVDAYGLEAPYEYECDNYHRIDLLREKLECGVLIQYDVIYYASGAGVQAALTTDPKIMYSLNVLVPIEITIQLKKHQYKGIYISFGSYMEIGVNDDDSKIYTEIDVVCSVLPVTNDYALSKRLYSRYMKDFNANFTFYHFVLPNMFSEDDLKPGTRLVPYTLQYLQSKRCCIDIAEPTFSAGFQTRQFISMEEMIDIVQDCVIKKIPSGIYNVGGGEFMSIRSLIERLFAIYKVPCKESFFGKETRRDGDIKSLHIDGNKLYNAIKKLPSKTIENIFAIQK